LSGRVVAASLNPLAGGLTCQEARELDQGEMPSFGRVAF